MGTLLQTTEKTRVDTEEEAITFIQNERNAAAQQGYEVKKSSYTAKQKKSKGEIVDSWYVVEIVKKFNEESEF